MNKKAQFLEVMGMLMIIGIAIYGTASVYYQKENLYAGIKNSSAAYKYTECADYINSFPKENVVVFTSKDRITDDFKIKKCD